MDRTQLAMATAVVVDPHPGDYVPLEKPSGVSQLRLFQLDRLVQQRTNPTFLQKRFQFHFVSDGRSALRVPRRNGSALWIINTRLPDMTGFELYEMLAPQLERTPVFLVANEYSAADEREAFRLGVSKFLCKPVAPAWLAGLRRIRPVPAIAQERQVPRAPPPGAPSIGQPPVFYEHLDDP